MRSLSFKSALPYFIIFIAGILVFGLFFAPAIYYDDWQNLVGRFYYGLSTWVNPGFSRPFRETTWKLLISLFGFNPGPILASNILIRIATSLLLYQIFKEMLPPARSYVALLFALLTMIYPADKTRMWMVIINAGWTFSCFTAWLLYRYSRKGSPWLLVGVTLGYIFILLEYEGPLGILAAWSLLLLIYNFPVAKPFGRVISWLRWTGLALPLIFSGIYLFYRLYWVDMIGIGGFHQVKSAALLSLGKDLWTGAKTLAWGWLEPLHALAPGMRISWLVAALFLLGSVLILASWLITLRLARRSGWQPVSAAECRQGWLQAGLTCLSGMVLAAAGYFPFITYAPPAIDFFPSRFNAYALVGASLFVVGLLDLAAWWTARYQRQVPVLLTLWMLPFLVIGASSELLIQRQTQLLWQEYRQMWQGVFNAAPGIKEDTAVVLVITHTPCKPDQFGERPYLFSNMANWELSDAFNAFYGTQKISADFVYQGCNLPYQVRFRGEGYNNPPSYDGVYPYSRALIFSYNRQTRQVSLVKNLKDITGFDDPNYRPDLLLTPGPGPNQMRYLVQP